MFYLVIPIIAILIIINSYPELSKERFIGILIWIIPTSLVIIIISQLSNRYKKGETKKFIINILYVISTLIWVYGFIGGKLVVTEKWMEYSFSIHLWKYITLIIIASVINILYYTLEWRYYKQENKKHDEVKRYIDENKINKNISVS